MMIVADNVDTAMQKLLEYFSPASVQTALLAHSGYKGVELVSLAARLSEADSAAELLDDSSEEGYGY